MGANTLSSMEIDAIGEILNISLGASATAVSTMLDARVDITTPVVKVVTKSEFTFDSLEPAVGVEITYVEGLQGKNIMLLKKEDVRIIVGMLMGTEIPVEEFELDEMSISAICEVMNQMMGASATALSELLGRTVNISTPHSEEIRDGEEFKEKSFTGHDRMVSVHFILKIADKMESEFVNLMPLELAKELVAGLFPGEIPADAEESEENKNGTQAQSLTSGADEPVEQKQAENKTDTSGSGMLSQEEIDRLRQQAAESAASEASEQKESSQPQTVQPPEKIAENSTSSGTLEQTLKEMEKLQQAMLQQMQTMQQMQVMQQTALAKTGPRQINVHAMPEANLYGADGQNPEEVNMDLVLGVPVEVSVEIGRTRKYVKDILELNKGSLVVLDKLAGEQVDLFVNGQCIAKGDVVVVDDNFGIRITEILHDEIEVTV